MPLLHLSGENIMRLSKTLVASAALLLTNSITTLADEPTHIPATAQSKVNAAVIAKADHALRDSLPTMSNVWIFATGDANSVFVSYTTSTPNESHAGAKSSEHLALVEMQGDHITTLRDLNSSATVVLTAASR
jgi:hypothetical protein